MKDLEKLDLLPNKVPMRNPQGWGNRRTDYHSIKGAYPYQYARRILEKYKGQCVDKAFSEFCQRYPKYWQKYFWKEVVDTTFWRRSYNKFCIDSKGNVSITGNYLKFYKKYQDEPAQDYYLRIQKRRAEAKRRKKIIKEFLYELTHSYLILEEQAKGGYNVAAFPNLWEKAKEGIFDKGFEDYHYNYWCLMPATLEETISRKCKWQKVRLNFLLLGGERAT